MARPGEVAKGRRVVSDSDLAVLMERMTSLETVAAVQLTSLAQLLEQQRSEAQEQSLTFWDQQKTFLQQERTEAQERQQELKRLFALQSPAPPSPTIPATPAGPAWNPKEHRDTLQRISRQLEAILLRQESTAEQLAKLVVQVSPGPTASQPRHHSPVAEGADEVAPKDSHPLLAKGCFLPPAATDGSNAQGFSAPIDIPAAGGCSTASFGLSSGREWRRRVHTEPSAAIPRERQNSAQLAPGNMQVRHGGSTLRGGQSSEPGSRTFSLEGSEQLSSDKRREVRDLIKSLRWKQNRIGESPEDVDAHMAEEAALLRLEWIAPILGGRHSHRLMSFVQWFAALREPQRNGPLACVVDSSVFEVLVMLVIICNGILTFWSTNYLIENVPQGPTELMNAAEIFFLCVYSTEVFVKILVHRAFFLLNVEGGWNAFDMLLIILSITNLLVENYAENHAAAFTNMTFLRSCRLLKVVRILRIFRLLRFFGELRLMLNCLLGCVYSLMWAFVLLAFLLGMFAIFFVQDVTNYMSEAHESMNSTTKDTFKTKFGTVGKSMITLTQAVTGGDDWENTYRLLVQTGIISPTLFVCFIVFFMIAIWNVVTSLFIDRTMKLAAPDLETLMFERRSQDLSDAKELMMLARKLDSDDSGTISVSEFLRFCRDPNFRSYFEVRGIDIKDAASFFQMLTDVNGSKEIDLFTFVQGCMRLKGYASSIDLATLMFKFDVAERQTRQFQALCLEDLDDVQETLAYLQTRLDSMGEPSRIATDPGPSGGGSAQNLSASDSDRFELYI